MYPLAMESLPNKELGIASDTKYFNAGVMVVNLDWWRRNRVTDKAVAYLKKYRKTVFFGTRKPYTLLEPGSPGFIRTIIHRVRFIFNTWI